MEKEVDKWISIVHEAWHSLIDDFERLGETSGYGHMREEDIRSYLFCKISEILRKRGEWVASLHAEQPLPEKRADIVVGFGEGESWLVGVEIKQTGQHKLLKEDLDKLQKFMKDVRIKAGILAAVAIHWIDWEMLFKEWRFTEKFKLEHEDKGNNNYWEIRELKQVLIGKEMKKLDSLFFVLRKP